MKNFNGIDVSGIANNAYIGLKYQKINQINKGYKKIRIKNWEIGKLDGLKIKANKPLLTEVIDSVEMHAKTNNKQPSYSQTI